MIAILIVSLVSALIVIVILVLCVLHFNKRFQNWRQTEGEFMRKQGYGEATAAFKEQTPQIREQAIRSSRAVITGQVIEQLVPFLPEFKYNPKDARFLGKPIDLLVFDGLDQGILKEIVFIEVKTGSSALSDRGRKIRDAVLAGHVKWEELRIDHRTV